MKKKEHTNNPNDSLLILSFLNSQMLFEVNNESLGACWAPAVGPGGGPRRRAPGWEMYAHTEKIYIHRQWLKLK